MKQTFITVHNYRDFNLYHPLQWHIRSRSLFVSLVPKYLFYFTNRTKYSPTLIHFLGSKSPWLHSLYRESGWSLCLLATWRIKEFHLATMSAPNPCFVEVAHQYRCFCMPLIQWAIISQPFSLLPFRSFFVIDLATCQMSKKWYVSTHDSRIHFAILLCRSEINTPIVSPRPFRKAKHLWHPSNSVCWLPPVSLAWGNTK